MRAVGRTSAVLVFALLATDSLAHAEAVILSDMRQIRTEARVSDSGRVLAEEIREAPVPLDIGFWGSGGAGYTSANALPEETPSVGASSSAYQVSGWYEGAKGGFPDLLMLGGRCRAVATANGDGVLLNESAATSSFEISFQIDAPGLLRYVLIVESIEDSAAVVPAGLASVELRGDDGSLVMSESLASTGEISYDDEIIIPAGAYTLEVRASRDLLDAVQGTTRGESFALCNLMVNPEVDFTPTFPHTGRIQRRLEVLEGGPAALVMISDERSVSSQGHTICIDGSTDDEQSFAPKKPPSPRAWTADAAAQAIGVRPVIVTDAASQRSTISDHGLLFAEGFAALDSTRFPPASGNCVGDGDGRSTFDVTFELEQAQPFRLSGMLATAVDLGPGIPGGWSLLRLERIENPPAEPLIDYHIGVFGPLTNSISLLHVGVLPTGLYRMQAEAYRFGGPVNNGSTSHGESYYSVLMRIGRLAADLTDDGLVNVDDLLTVINSWGPCPPPCTADATGNGVVDIDDLLQVINNWSP